MVLERHFSSEDFLTCHNFKNTGVINNINDGWIPFSSSWCACGWLTNHVISNTCVFPPFISHDAVKQAYWSL